MVDAPFKAQKVVAALPATLAPSTLYFVRTGDGFDLYLSDFTGGVAHKLNLPKVPDEFGTGPVASADYIAARGLDLITNGTGFLGNTYNMPDDFVFDPVETPGLPASFAFAGYYGGVSQCSEAIAVDPSQVYRLSMSVHQESVVGDWSAFAKGERHLQYAGILCFDSDGETIREKQHMRFKQGGADSLTTLSAPLTPGDTRISLVSAAGWNTSSNSASRRGVGVFGYKNTAGRTYKNYTRLVQYDLFDLGGVDADSNTVVLNKQFPSALGNPDDPGGTWPAGTRIANSASGGTYKYSVFSGLVVPQTDQWYRVENYIGGVDASGTNRVQNFPPGTASVKLFWLPNYSNRAAGWGAYPDTGAGHKVRFAGLSVVPEPTAILQTRPDGGQDIFAPTPDIAAGVVKLELAKRSVVEIAV